MRTQHYNVYLYPYPNDYRRFIEDNETGVYLVCDDGYCVKYDDKGTIIILKFQSQIKAVYYFLKRYGKDIYFNNVINEAKGGKPEYKFFTKTDDWDSLNKLDAEAYIRETDEDGQVCYTVKYRYTVDYILMGDMSPVTLFTFSEFDTLDEAIDWFRERNIDAEFEI